MDRLVSREERIIPKDMNFRTVLTYDNRQKLYEKRLKLTKALPIIQHEMSELESENESKISLYITQKSEFMTILHMLIDQTDANNLFPLVRAVVGRLLVFLLRPRCALVLGNGCERLCTSRPLLGSYVHQESI